jgi:NDP-sugar pyrophosphorylase family protein
MAKRMTTAIVLAAGAGTRLRPYTDVIPKALMPVGHKPCIAWIVDDLFQQHIEKIIIAVNISDLKMFQHEFHWRHKGLYFSVSDKPRGTSGNLLQALHDIRTTWPILVVYADDLTKTDYNMMLRHHENSRMMGTLACTRNNKLEIGIIKVNGHGIEEIYEKPEIGRLGYTSWTGRAILESGIMDYLRPDEDLASSVFPNIKDKLGVYETDSPWLDIGNIQHYAKACELAREGKL